MRDLTVDDVVIEVIAAPEDMEIEGNAMASGDDDIDAQAENDIREQLDNGNEWAWCTIEVRAYHPDFPDIVGTDTLGGCSYKSKQDFIDCNDYYKDMVSAAIDELNAQLKRVAEFVERFED